jgi:uncharacterized protein (UPF0332 family)
MNPEAFMVLAVKLSGSSGEAERRSAVSRSYYGLFHCACLLVEECGVVCPESAEAHDKVAKCLQHSGDAAIDAVGKELNSFRTVRNQADYRLTDVRFTDAKFIQIQLGVARRAFTTLLDARADTGRIRGPIRKYAKGILKLPVRGDD